MNTATLVEPGDGFAHWHDVTCRRYSLTECRPVADAHFRARVGVREFGPLRFNEISSATPADDLIRVSRGPDQIRRDPRDDFFLWLALEGRTDFAQAGRSVRLHAGDLMLHDQARPFTLAFGPRAHAVMVSIARPLLTARLVGAERLVARPIAGRSRLGALAGSLVRECLRMDDAGDAPWTWRVADSSLDLWATALETELADAAPRDDRTRRRLAEAQRQMLSRLGEPGLSIESIAQACNMSPRTLMRLFAAEGTTPIRWLWQQRLAAACRALAGTRGASVTEVALSCGFSELSHFSRAFKAEFGRSPREVAAGAAPRPRLPR